MLITFGSRRVEIPVPDVAQLMRLSNLKSVNRRTHEAIERGYAEGARETLKAIENGRGARLEHALLNEPKSKPEAPVEPTVTGM